MTQIIFLKHYNNNEDLRNTAIVRNIIDAILNITPNSCSRHEHIRASLDFVSSSSMR